MKYVRDVFVMTTEDILLIMIFGIIVVAVFLSILLVVSIVRDKPRIGS